MIVIKNQQNNLLWWGTFFNCPSLMVISLFPFLLFWQKALGLIKHFRTSYQQHFRHWVFRGPLQWWLRRDWTRTLLIRSQPYNLRELAMTITTENSMNMNALSSGVFPALTHLCHQSYYQTYTEHVQNQFKRVWYFVWILYWFLKNEILCVHMNTLGINGYNKYI